MPPSKRTSGLNKEDLPVIIEEALDNNPIQERIALELQRADNYNGSLDRTQEDKLIDKAGLAKDILTRDIYQDYTTKIITLPKEVNSIHNLKGISTRDSNLANTKENYYEGATTENQSDR